MLNNNVSLYSSVFFIDFNLKKDLDKIYDDLNLINSVFANNIEFSRLINNSYLSKQTRKQIIFSVFKQTNVSDYLINWLFVLIDNNYLEKFYLIYKEFIRLYYQKNNILKVKIISSYKLTTNDIKKIEDKISKKYQDYSSINFEYNVDETYIAGLVIKIGNHVYDNTLKAKINSIRKGFNYEY